MAKTRTRPETPPAPAEGHAGAPPQTLDDRTPIDDLEAKKRKRERKRKPRQKQEAVPPGYVRRLPAGKERVVTVNKSELGKEDGLPLRVADADTGEAVETDAVKIEGESEAGATGFLSGSCAPTGIGLRTRAPILIGRSRAAAPPAPPEATR